MSERTAAVLIFLSVALVTAASITAYAVFGQIQDVCEAANDKQADPLPPGYRLSGHCVRRPISFCVDPEGGPILDRPLREYAQEAIDDWSYVAGVPLPLSVSGTCPGAGTRRGDGRNVIGWTPPESPFGGRAKYDLELDHSVEEADIELTVRRDLTRQIWCLPSLLLHELGHVLGLAHQGSPASIMNPSVPCDQRVPSPEDAAAVRLLYSK